MKTKQEVIDYVLNVGHTTETISKINGFLIGKELKENDEVLMFKRGRNDWESFSNWFNGKSKKSNDELVSMLFGLVFDAIDKEEDESKEADLRDVLSMLLDIFIVDVSKIEGNNKNHK